MVEIGLKVYAKEIEFSSENSKLRITKIINANLDDSSKNPSHK